MEWVAIIGLVITLAVTAYSMYQQSEQTAAANRNQQKMEEARDKQIEENYALSIQSANEQYRALQRRQQQEGIATNEKELQGAREGAMARSTARVAAGEAGVGGLSVNALLNDFMAQESRYRESLKTNLGFTRDQLSSEMEGVRATAEGRVQSNLANAKSFAPIENPNYFGAAMRVGGAAMDTYNKYKSPSTSGQGSDTASGLNAQSVTWQSQQYNYS